MFLFVYKAVHVECTVNVFKIVATFKTNATTLTAPKK